MAFLVLIFGEDVTDSSAVAYLVEAINDSRSKPVAELQTRTIRDPPILRRDSSDLKLKSQAQKIAGFVRGYSKKNRMVIAVAHRDCDAVEPEHESCVKELLDDLSRAGVQHAVVAAPAWEIEAWWMLFPDAVNQLRDCWRPIDYGHSNVGVIANAKERLRRDLRPTGRSSCPDYAERDGIKIAQNIKNRGLSTFSIKARSLSFERFVNDLNSVLD